MATEPENKNGRFSSLLTIISKPVTFITTLSVFLAAVVHVITFVPEARKTMFPVHEIVLLDFYNRARLVLANTGDFDYHVSHISYSHRPYSESTLAAMDQLLSERRNELEDSCTELYDAAIAAANQEQVETTRESASVICDGALKQADSRLASLRNPNDPLNPSIPGEKNRGLGIALPSQQTVEFDLSESNWSNCNYLKVDSDDSSEIEQTMDQALALWAVSYQNVPGLCLEADYFFRESRNYLANREDSPFLRASIPSGGAVHYSVMEIETRSTSAETLAESGHYTRTELPDLLSNLKYRDSPACSRFIEKFIDVNAVSNEGGSVCFNPY